jgi:hypothetical protein
MYGIKDEALRLGLQSYEQSKGISGEEVYSQSAGILIDVYCGLGDYENALMYQKEINQSPFMKDDGLHGLATSYFYLAKYTHLAKHDDQLGNTLDSAIYYSLPLILSKVIIKLPIQIIKCTCSNETLTINIAMTPRWLL